MIDPSLVVPCDCPPSIRPPGGQRWLALTYLVGHEEEIILTFFTVRVVEPPPAEAAELAAPSSPMTRI